ncbi:MAG: low affinity iron permease family protein [Proteobacteria bacterium]|nr:MAG: low affinity iron permease family protein [Pseudomonadota bacterium]
MGFRRNKRKSFFSRFAKQAAYLTGTPPAFMIAVAVIIVWAVTGPIFQFNDTWQLVINTGTTIVTFLMVFLIQNAQNRDSAAVQLKLDELIRANVEAHDSLMDLEELESHELEKIRQKYEAIAAKARERLRSKQDPMAEFDIDKGC